MPAAFFTPHRESGRLGLALFLNAGDPPLPVLRELVVHLDACRRVDCLELAVPFPNSVSDGPVIRRSAARALDRGTDLAAVLAFLRSVRPRLGHLKVALLADWGHTVRPSGLSEFLPMVATAGADALLVHGLPPAWRGALYAGAEREELPVVTTCYASSAAATVEEAARHASAYVYLVAHYGRTGTTPATGFANIAPVIEKIRATSDAPVAVGFGVKVRAHLDLLRGAGADAAIVGSACVDRIERAWAEGGDVVASVADLIDDLRPTPPAGPSRFPAATAPWPSFPPMKP